MKHVRTFLLLLLMVVLVTFAVANRETIGISLWPFPLEAEMPLFFVFFFGIFIGIALAGIFVAFKGAKHYVEMRSAKKETSKLSGEVDSLEQELDKVPTKIDQKNYSEETPGTTRKLAKKDKGP